MKKPPPKPDKGKPEVNPESLNPSGSKLPISPPGSKHPVPPPGGNPAPSQTVSFGAIPPPGSKLPIPPPGFKLPVPPPGGNPAPSQTVSFGGIPPTTASGRAAGPSRQAPKRGGFIPGRGPLPSPPGGLPPIRGGIYRVRAPGQLGLGRKYEAEEPIQAASNTMETRRPILLSLGSIIRATEMIISVYLVFLHGGYFFFVTKTSIIQLTNLVAFPLYLMARSSCSMYRRRWIPDTADAILSSVAALNYIAVCVTEVATLSGNQLGFLPDLKNLKTYQIAICFKIICSGMLAGLLIFDCFIHITRLKNMKLQCTFN